MVDITFAVTSCGRMDLLEKTLVSFFKHNTYPIKKTIIVDDSGGSFDADRIAKVIPGDYEFIINEHNIGQIRSVDRLYSKINTPYIFHCEDDWEFFENGFIEESLSILEDHPDMFTVWLRAHDDTNGHPIASSDKSFSQRMMVKKYRGVWSGFTFNPGLRRRSDYLLLAPYADQAVVHVQRNKKIASEVDLSILYDNLGFGAAISSRQSGFVRHIGWGDHIPQEWERKLIRRCLVAAKNFINKYLIRRS